MADNGKFRRVDVGFKAGAVLSLRVQDAEYDKLRAALNGDRGWLEVESEESAVALDLSDVVYVRRDIDRGRVGF